MRITAKYLLESLGAKVIPPPAVSQKTIEIGLSLCDEQYCMPFKVNVGDIVRAVEAGANTVLAAQSEGLCRFGGLWVPQKKIVERYFGKEIDFIPINQFDSMSSINKLIDTIKITISKEELIDVIERTIYKIDLCNEATGLSNYIRPRAVNKRKLSDIFWTAIDKIDTAKTWKDIKDTKDKIHKLFSDIPVNDKIKPVKIMLTGSIFDVAVPSSKFQLVEILGNMGAEVIPTLEFHDIIVLKNIAHDEKSKIRASEYARRNKELSQAAKKYIGVMASYYGFGGFAMQTVGNAALAKEKGFDGIVHIYPFGCMPEIVARSMLKKISKDTDIPILSLSIDEHTAAAGFLTRIEAFMDIVRR